MFAVTAKLICVFVFAYAKSRVSHDEAHIIGLNSGHCSYKVDAPLIQLQQLAECFCDSGIVCKMDLDKFERLSDSLVILRLVLTFIAEQFHISLCFWQYSTQLK